MRDSARANVVALALAAALTGCSREGAVGTAPSASPVEVPSSARAAGAFDIGFCQAMTMHHGQAILMSENVIGRAGPRVRTLAIAILSGQSEEAGMMKGWLALWGASQLASVPMAWMHDAGGGAGAGGAMGGMADERMHGMASQAELATLASEHGKALDVRFLQLMIRHHEAGIAMATYAQRRARNDLVRGIAAEMAVDQTNEILVMRRLLADDGGTPLPMN